MQSSRTTLTQARDFQDILDLTRLWAGDRKFQVGTQILRHAASAEEAGKAALSGVADAVLESLSDPVLEELSRNHGRVAGPGLAVLALGKLGSREMTVTSDLDLVFIYSGRGRHADASGRPQAPARASPVLRPPGQRFINALSAQTAEGRLYEIDMRLRPLGEQPARIAVSN